VECYKLLEHVSETVLRQHHTKQQSGIANAEDDPLDRFFAGFRGRVDGDFIHQIPGKRDEHSS
jgi:hypothetical protein